MKAVLHKRDSKIFNRNGSIIIDNKNKVKLNEIEWNKHIISEMKRFESKIVKQIPFNKDIEKELQYLKNTNSPLTNYLNKNKTLINSDIINELDQSKFQNKFLN